MNTKRTVVLAAAAAIGIAATASTATATTVPEEEGGDSLTFHVITHSDDGPFWTVVKRGVDAAAEDLGIEVIWLGSNNDPEAQVQLIDQALSEGSAGIASSLPSPDQLVGPLTAAAEGGHPDRHAQLGRRLLAGDRCHHPRRPDRVHRRSGRR